MSLEQTATINCPFCQAEQQVSYYTSVNVTLEPALKTKVLAGRLNALTCKDCEKETWVQSGFLYHDMQNRLMINLRAGDTSAEFEGTEIMGDLKSQGYIYREVFSYPELVEKINVFDQKLNDNVVSEITRLLKGMMSEVAPDATFHVYFKSFDKGLFKKKLVFECFSHPGQVMELKYDFKKLDAGQQKDLENLDVLRNG